MTRPTVPASAGSFVVLPVTTAAPSAIEAPTTSHASAGVVKPPTFTSRSRALARSALDCLDTTGRVRSRDAALPLLTRSVAPLSASTLAVNGTQLRTDRRFG